MAAKISGKADPVVLRITRNDIVEALAKGLRDFQAAPRYGLLLGGLCAAGGIAIVLCLTALGMTYFAYPIAAGFSLIAPFLATSLYEVSRRIETGQTLPTWSEIWTTVTGRSEIRWMAFVTMFIMIMWMYQVRLLMALFLGFKSFASLEEFLTTILTTNEGLLFLAIGNLVGALLSVVLFSLTVVSFPLVLDRETDFVTAMITSVRAVATNPGPMIGWAAVVVMLMILSALPMFLGLVVTLPVLGHATWHLYRRVVAPENSAAGPAGAAVPA